ISRESTFGRKDIGSSWQDISLYPGSSFPGDLEGPKTLPAKSSQSEFSLRPSVNEPYNVFFPLSKLQPLMGLTGRANALLVSDGMPRDNLQERLQHVLRLDDWGVSIWPAHTAYLNLQSRELFVETQMEKAAAQTAKELNIPIAPTLVYLANSISDGKNEIPYSVVAALDPSLPPPLGPFLP